MNNKIKVVNKHNFGLGANVLMLAGAFVLVSHGLEKLIDTLTKCNEYNEKYDPDSCDWLKKDEENSTEEPETTE